MDRGTGGAAAYSAPRAGLPTPAPTSPHEPTRLHAYPHPAASPRITPATSQIAAAVVRPLSESSPWCFCLLFLWLGRTCTTPAPMNPTPLATCAAARALSENSSLPTPGLGQGAGSELGCTFRSGRVLLDELATPVKSAAPMHTIDIVRMPAGRPAHPRSTPITEPRAAASSKLRHSCSSSAKTIPPRNRCNAICCGNLPVSLRRGEPVLENRKRGEWLLATHAASTTSSMTSFKPAAPPYTSRDENAPRRGHSARSWRL